MTSCPASVLSSSESLSEGSSSEASLSEEPISEERSLDGPAHRDLQSAKEKQVEAQDPVVCGVSSHNFSM